MSETVLQIPGVPYPLKLVFNQSTYRMMEKVTGINHFETGPKRANMASVDFCVGVLFAATRKHHKVVSLDLLNEWLDEVPSHEFNKLCGEVFQAYVESIKGPDAPLTMPVTTGPTTQNSAEKTLPFVSMDGTNT